MHMFVSRLNVDAIYSPTTFDIQNTMKGWNTLNFGYQSIRAVSTHVYWIIIEIVDFMFKK